MPRRVTQKEIAAAAQVHPSTVCLSLANSPLIPAATRERVLAVAAKLGYTRDPMLSALAAYRRSQRAPGYHGVLGWMVNSADNYRWRAPAEYRNYYDGAKERAATLGYQLAVFDVHEYRHNLDRLTQILRTRNIRGLLICPQPRPHTMLPLNFDDFSAVTFGYTLQSPVLHMVSTHHYGAIRDIVRELRARQYRRIGFAFPAVHNERIDGTYMAGFMTEQQNWPRDQQLKPFTGDPELKPFRAWLAAQKPDAIVTAYYGFPQLLEDLKIKIPENLGVALTSVVDGVRRFSGIDEDSREIGRVAVALLASLVERGEYGIPARPQRVLVRGVWHEGHTLQPAPRAAG